MTNEEALKILSLKSSDLPYDEQNDKLFDAILIAEDSIIKQIPKKPVPDILRHRMECANCNNSVTWFQDKNGKISGLRYCAMCGQALDWSYNDDK